MSNNHRLSVLIPALNERDSLPQMLAELPKHLIDEIVVIDGHSTDGTPELVRELKHAAIDDRASLSGYVERIFREFLSRRAPEGKER